MFSAVVANPRGGIPVDFAQFAGTSPRTRNCFYASRLPSWGGKGRGLWENCILPLSVSRYFWSRRFGFSGMLRSRVCYDKIGSSHFSETANNYNPEARLVR